MPRIVSDIDGTVFNAGKPIKKVIDYIRKNSEEVVFLTNRPESERKKTVSDLKKVGLKYESLIMNTTGESAPVFKKDVIKKMVDGGRRVAEFIDDRADTRKAVKSLGVKVTDPASIHGDKNIDKSASYSNHERLAKSIDLLEGILKNILKEIK